MKLDERRFDELLRLLPELRVVLLYGDDPEWVAERAGALARGIVGGGSETFPATELVGPEHSRATEALNSPMLGQAVRLVRLRDATDAAAPTIEAILVAPGDGLLLIEAGALLSRSRLRAVVERSRLGAAMACRGPDAARSIADIGGLMEGVGRRIDPEAVALLLARADSPRGALLDAEKLALLVSGGTGAVSVREVNHLSQNGQSGELDELVHQVSAGAWPAADLSLEAFLAGGQPTGLLRALLFHFHRLRSARALVMGGATVEAAFSSLRPPVFFSRLPAMRQALRMWEVAELDAACAMIWCADRSCRETAAPAAAICRKIVFDLCERSVGLARSPF